MATANRRENARARKLPTQDELKALLHYDPDTGIFAWRSRQGDSQPVRSWNTRWAGKDAGSMIRGRISIRLFGCNYQAGPLAWLYMTGGYPDRFVDHIDNDASNNRWINLRLATLVENSWNAGLRKDNTSGFKGVRKKPGTQFWLYSIRCRGVRETRSGFKTAQEAHEEYLRRASKLFGQFARGR